MVPCGRRGTDTILSSPLGFSIHTLPAALALLEKGGVASHGTSSMGNSEPCFKGSLPTPASCHSWGGDKDGLKKVPSQSHHSLR